ncbi:Sugar phosphate isomerase/epimerase [Abditibacterium utsteinense]|uniref:Sugar phosphate isomerase/epimerase n=1 Tax=Abditibacterium utsteinense TaxID=1960156 RepID=A0A2S8SVA0_9BACT|nr:sugar phosphate isomerase/epimerase [Abditibacterium utsteinense]PQV64720.1 Sugar phosphate isomerase/epimerase [Abditibacterium utsteinense]
MKLALQLSLTPGKTPGDKARWAKDHGVQGLELNAASNASLRAQADEIGDILPICSVCANATLEGEMSFDFLHPDKTKRRASIEGSKAILKFCGEVGAVGQIVPPIFGGPAVPDLSPFLGTLQLEDQLMIAALQELGPIAAENKTLFMLEPLNRYEQHYLRKQSDAVRLIDAAQTPGIGLLSDFFHMHIEETSTPQAFRNAKGYTSHLHLADNTRMEPGSGDIDFVSSFKVLVENGFDGFMAYECGISGDSEAEKAENLAKSLDYMRSCLDKAQNA